MMYDRDDSEIEPVDAGKQAKAPERVFAVICSDAGAIWATFDAHEKAERYPGPRMMEMAPRSVVEYVRADLLTTARKEARVEALKEALGILNEFGRELRKVDFLARLESTVGEQWQPIETAPKDRTILLAGEGLEGWLQMTGYWADTDWYFIGGGWMGVPPTRWMSLHDPSNTTVAKE